MREKEREEFFLVFGKRTCKEKENMRKRFFFCFSSFPGRKRTGIRYLGKTELEKEGKERETGHENLGVLSLGDVSNLTIILSGVLVFF